ncbi:uncharacterized protein H6S33_005632 [Morchella sextelata]|uniref:uncharacterized protein n=1 Tax=Morchella sextelata TaxID=1174677 RepID=UPI001D0395FF|nr:uncharacterized protein H6S33_005632 [Morchella sextelata]KAH0613746.1 hypothetical protein H6S33_005632 [Morchella sextelata]
MPPKRQSSASSTNSTAAAPGAGSSGDFYAADEFTRTVKKRLATATRTGQACDRCKVRKIRCDGLPGGCSPCMQNRTECKTTDRISQKAVPRGYLEALEAKCALLEQKNKDMENTLARMGMENRNNGYQPRNNNPNSDWALNGSRPVVNDRWGNSRKDFQATPTAYSSPSTGCCTATTNDRLCNSIRTASFRPGSTSSHYLGISSGSSYLSSIKASALSLLGIDIDLSDLDPNEPNHPSNANDETFSSCLSTIFNVNPNVPKVELPPKEKAYEYVNWFFAVSHPYLPILHQPTFMKMLERIYTDKTYEPSPAQIVMVHMIFAIVDFQNASQDRMVNRGHNTTLSTETMQRSRMHYHYALSFFYGLLNTSGLEDLQAIGLILQHIRGFPKPGGSWLLSRIAISMCFELGLHRSPKKWAYSGSTNPIDIELRKRVFWSILTLEVSLSARLGRPMSIRETDFDVEYPERLDDEFITETGYLKREGGNEDCAFDVSIEMFKFTSLYIEMLGTLYAPARPSREKYVSLVEELEGKLLKWKEQAPKSLSLDSPKPEKRFQAAHLHSWFHECRVLMRHPSLSLSPSPSFTNDCIRICVDSSRQILHQTDELRKGSHYLDTTWSGATIQLLATLTILFSVWEKRDTVTPDEVVQVKTDMDLCMDIMGDVGSLLGSPNKLREVVQVLTHGTMELLNRKRGEQDQRTQPASRGSHNSPYPPFTAGPTPPGFVPSSTGASKMPPTSHITSDQYPAVYNAVHDLRGGHIPIFTDAANMGSLPEDQSFGHVTTMGPAPYNGFTQPPVTFASTTEPPTASAFGWWSGNESWREYAQCISTMAGELDPTETYSASALIALGRDCDNGSILRPDASSHNGAPSTSGISLGTVNATGSPGASISTSRNPYPPQEATSASWPILAGSYGYADSSALRGVGGDTGNNGS